MKLNLGCGKDIREGYENIDKIKIKGAKQVDVDKGLPYKENTFSEILCNKSLAYIDDLVFVMNELYRVAKPGCIIKIRNAYYNSQNGFADPVRKRTFTLDSFDRLIELYGFKGKFKAVRKELIYTRLGKMIPFEPIRRKLSLIFGEIASEAYVELKVIK